MLTLAACSDDRDGDGFIEEVDCDDDDAEVNPDAVEVCDDVDNNCDGNTDEPQAIDALAWWVDADGDGYGDPARLAKACDHPTGWVDNGDDCDDADSSIVPPC